MSASFSIQKLCSVLACSRSAFYAWKKRLTTPRQQQNLALARAVATTFQEKRRLYGALRLTAQLHLQGFRCGHNRVARLMQKQGLKAQQKARFRSPRRDPKDKPLSIPPNLLASAGPASGPNQIWVADITYLRSAQGWLYLAALMDLFSRKIVGWSLQDHLKTPLIQQALAQAQTTRRAPAGLLHHSDRGCQYTSDAYQQTLLAHGFSLSMSRPGCCHDNAAMESFWSTLKSELDLKHHRFPNRAHAQAQLFEYIEIFYNRERLHSSIHYMSPAHYEQKQLSTPTLQC
jgi:transposase InsO family protein